MKDLSDLDPLVGRWVTTITMLHPPEIKGEQYRAVDTYRWMSGRSVLLHEVEAQMPDMIVSSLEVYTVQAGTIRSRNFDSSGAVSDYRCSMRDGVWRVKNETQEFSSTAIAESTIDGLWKLKTDGDWVDWMTVHLDRVA